MRRLIHLIYRLPGQSWRLLVQRFLPWLSYLASYLRRPSQIVAVWPEHGIAVGSQVALFVHFDAGGAVRPYVLNYLRALRETGLSLVVVSNSGRLRPEAMAALQTLCDGIIVRRNIGYDFGAMREGVEYLALPRPDTEMVLLVNDSVYGPLQPLGPVLQRIDFAAADIWGLTESWQTQFHLQSFFMAFGRPALTSRAWPEFWGQVRPVSSKWWVILHYEVGLTQHFLRVGLRARALWPYRELVQELPALEFPAPAEGGDVDRDGFPRLMDPIARGRIAHLRHLRGALSVQVPLNPTSDFWRILLRSGFPFIKRELLRKNPTGVGDLADWRDEVQASGGGDLETIERDLQRALRNRAV